MPRDRQSGMCAALARARTFSCQVFHMHSDETFERFLAKTDASTGGAVRRAIQDAASAPQQQHQQHQQQQQQGGHKDGSCTKARANGGAGGESSIRGDDGRGAAGVGAARGTPSEKSREAAEEKQPWGVHSTPRPLANLTGLCEVDSRISFTLPLRLPTKGAGGLRYLDFRGTSSRDCTPDSSGVGGGGGGGGGGFGSAGSEGAGGSTSSAGDGLGGCGSLAVEAYEAGTLYVHNATLPHQIMPWPYHGLSDGPRITMQGFGFNCGGVWYLYW